MAQIFGNPASLDINEIRWIYFNSQAWLHGSLVAIPLGLEALFTNKISANTLLTEHITIDGVGYGASLGFGFFGKNIVVGLRLTEDLFLGNGKRFPNDLKASMITDLELTVGLWYSWQFADISLAIGGAIAPLFRINTTFDNAQTHNFFNRTFGAAGIGARDYLNTPSTNYGYAIAFHLGAVLEWNILKIGVGLRDIANTQINYYSRTSLNSLWQQIQQFSLFSPPSQGDDADTTPEAQIFPMDIHIGAAINPDFELPWLNLTFNLEFSNLPALLRLGPSLEALIRMIHAGATAKFNDFFTLSVGYNRGNIAVGTGFKFDKIQINTSWQQALVPSRPNTNSRTGLAIEFMVLDQD